MADAGLTTAERVVRVLEHLGLQQAHVAGGSPADVAGLLQAHPDRVASLTLVCPARLPPQAVQSCSEHLLIIVGDQGPPAAMVQQAVETLPGASVVMLPEYMSPPWADSVADRTAQVEDAMMGFLASPHRQPIQSVDLRPQEGEIAGMTYRVQGSGSPLVLLPLNLASTQWDALLPRLSERYCTIILGGPELGFMPVLETRGQSWGYLSVVRTLIDEARLQPGETVLDVGCGSGVLDRWLARHTDKRNPIVGVDVNRYLLREATDLIQIEGLSDIITLREGNAEALPFPDNEFDVVISHTVMEEDNADNMLSEMVRVTKPGGRIAVMVRTLDVPWLVNVSLRAELKTKVEIPRGFVGEHGCADASLGKRFRSAGLEHVKMFPQFATYDDLHVAIGQFQHAAIVGALNVDETQEWQDGVKKAVEEGTFYIAQSHHCAVGTKP
jgi:SAM-dependent methyltransferase